METDSQNTAKQPQSMAQQSSTKLTNPPAPNSKKPRKPGPDSSEQSADLKHQTESPGPDTPNASSPSPRNSDMTHNTKTKPTQNQLGPNPTRSLVSLSSKEDSEIHPADDSIRNEKENKSPLEEKQKDVGLHAMTFQDDTVEANGDKVKSCIETSSPPSSSASESSEDDDQDPTSSDEKSSSSSEASIPSKRPRKRPSCNGIVRRTQGKKPRQMPPPPLPLVTASPKQEQQKRATGSSKLNKLSTPTAVKVIGKRGATIAEALAELDKRTSAKRGRGRPSKADLAERKRVENLKTRLQKEFRQLSSPVKGSGVKTQATNSEEDNEASSGEEMSSESTEEGNGPKNNDETNGDKNMISEMRPTRGNKSQKSFISDASRHSNTNASKTQGADANKKLGIAAGLKQSGEIAKKSPGGAVGKKKIPESVRKNLRETLDSKSLSSLSDQNDSKGSPSLTTRPAQQEQSTKETTALGSHAPEQSAKNVPAIIKKRRGRPPGSKNKASKSAKKVSFSGTGINKNKRLFTNVQDEELTTKRKTDLLKMKECEDSHDNSRAYSDSEGNGSGRQLRQSPRRKTSLLIQDESSSLMKDDLIAALRAELNARKEELEREKARSLELDEAARLSSGGDENDLYKLDEMCNRISELESKVAEQQEQLSEREDALRVKEAAMKGFLEQIKSFESRFEKGESRANIGNGVRSNENSIYTSVERLVELEADLENKTIEMQKLQTLVEAQQKTLRNVLIANKNLQQKIYKQAGIIGVDNTTS